MLRIVLAMTMAMAGPALADRAYVAGGCFWCVEKDFESVPGVREVVSGFIGGSSANPTYGDHAGHYEAVEIDFDPDRVSYAALMRLFFRSVDPTDADGQFCDRGDSYRSAVFVTDAAQKAAAEAAKSEAGAALGQRVVTPVIAAGTFWPAEAYHQGYYKSGDIIITRFGPRTKASAYKLYRKSCGRDDRVRALWGDEAAFAR